MKKTDNLIIYRMYENHKGKMFAIAYKMVGNASLAEDIVQDAFVKLIRYLDKKDETLDQDHLDALLVLITKQIAAREYKRKRRRGEVALVDNYDQEDRLDLAETVMNKMNHEAVLDTLHKNMKKDHVDMIILKYVYQFSSKEIAEIFGIRENNVNQILMRTRKKARKVLASAYGY